MSALTQLINAPLVSEKTALIQGAHNTYTVMVSNRATKTTLKMALKELYGISGATINIAKTRQKFARAAKGGLRQKRGVMTKAYITLAPGQVLDLTKLSV